MVNDNVFVCLLLIFNWVEIDIYVNTIKCIASQGEEGIDGIKLEILMRMLSVFMGAVHY